MDAISSSRSSSASFFFCSSSIVLDVLVGDLLHLVEPPPLVVFRDLVVLEQLLQPLVRVAADLADAVAALLGELVHDAATAPCGAPRSAPESGCGPPCRRWPDSARGWQLRIAFSIAPSSDGSNGCATISVGSGIDSDATWLSGIVEPYASTCTASRIVTEARPVRTPREFLPHVFDLRRPSAS